MAGLAAGNSMVFKFSQGLPAFWRQLEQPVDAGAGERNDFTKFTGEITRVQSLIPIGDVQTALKTSLTGQFTNGILPPSEQYLLGGVRFGRGFFAGEASGDRALGISGELQLNAGFDNLGPLNPDGRLDVQFYGFFDYGRAYNLVPGSLDHTIDSAGIGARGELTLFMSVELEGGHRLTTHVDGAAAPKPADYAVFSRVVLHY